MREVESAFEEALGVCLARELQRELHVLVFDLHRRLHPRRDRLGLLEAPLDSRQVLQDRVGQALAQPPDVCRAEAVDVGGVRPAPAQPTQRLEDDRRLADPPRT